MNDGDKKVFKENMDILSNIVFIKKYEESELSTNNSTKLSKFFKRFIVILIFLELVYLVIFNIVLNTSYIQNKVNDIAAGKLQLKWKNAWTPYPSRFYIENLTVNGESGSKSWQSDIRNISANISLLPLMKHRMKICNVRFDDINYSEEKTYASAGSHQAAEGGQSDKNVTVSEEGSGIQEERWTVELNGVGLYGHHTVETDRIKGSLDADIDTDLSVSTEDGMLTVNKGKITIKINDMKGNKGQKIIDKASLESSFKVAAVDLKKVRGRKLLKYLTLDSTVSAQMRDLDIFGKHLERIRGISLNGKGALNGHIHLEKGKIIPGSKIDINASSLSVKRREYSARGNGKIALAVTKKSPDTVEARITFGAGLEAQCTEKS